MADRLGTAISANPGFTVGPKRWRARAELIALGRGWGQTASVSRKRGIMLAAVLAAGLGGLLWLLFFTGEPEPVYQGKPLSKWLEAYPRPPSAYNAKEYQDANDAVRHIGTNAIPTLLRMLRARDSALTLKLLTLAQKQHLVKIRYIPASDRHSQAVRAFLALRADAKVAVPKLRRIYAEPQLVVPALVKMLSDPDPLVRSQAAWALGTFGPDAKAAVPALFKVLEDQDGRARHMAASAIKKIDPEAAALRKAELDAAGPPLHR